MQYTKQQVKATLLKMHSQDVQTMTPQQIADKYDVLRRQTGVNVFSLLNKGKSQNRFDINVLGGNSNGGRCMHQYKSGHRV